MAKIDYGKLADDTQQAYLDSRPKRTLKPRPYGSGHLTEAGFWAFIRSGLRAKSQRWWPIYDALAEARRSSQSSNKRLKWEFHCCKCDGWFARADVQVNHKIPCGSLKSFEDIGEFCRRLFVEKNGLEVVCTPCHLVITNGETSDKTQE